MSTIHNPRQNGLLAALPAADYARLLPHLELVPMPLGWTVFESGGKQTYAYFPVSSIISILYIMENGASAEVAITGNDGIVGIVLFMGGDESQCRAVVQSGGYAYRLKVSVLKEKIFGHGTPLHQLALRYGQALMAQMAQTAVCNRHHTVDQQLCRWLLISMDRMPTSVLMMTQEVIANMLGVRREGVTEAAGKLQDAGIIKYSRGHIMLLDRCRLEQRVCECYGVVRQEYARLLPYHNQLDKYGNTTSPDME